jgi:hypothetical protein
MTILFVSGIPNTQERTDVSGSPAKRERKIGGRHSGLVEICPIKRGFCLSMLRKGWAGIQNQACIFDIFAVISITAKEIVY